MRDYLYLSMTIRIIGIIGVVFVAFFWAGCKKKAKDTNHTYEIQKAKHSFLASYKHAALNHDNAVDNLRIKANQFNNINIIGFYDQLKDAWIDSWHAYQLLRPFSRMTGAISSPLVYDRDRVENVTFNLSFLDSTVAQPNSGIVFDDVNFPQINSNVISAAHNGSTSDKTVGYQVAEFIIWGEDNSVQFGGMRSVGDFGISSEGQRRRALLTSSIVNLRNEFTSNYTSSFEDQILKSSNEDFIRFAFSGFLKFLEDDFARDVLLKPYNSQNKDDELSRFSENTTTDIVSLMDAVELFLRGKGIEGTESEYYMVDLIGDIDPSLKLEIIDLIDESQLIASDIQGNFDNAISSNTERIKIYEMYTNLNLISQNLRSAISKMGIEL